MQQILDVRNWQYAFWVLIAISINTYYYSRIKHNKNIIEYTSNYFHWTPKMVIKNSGSDNNRSKYLKVNNKCLLTLWLMLVLQLIFLFFTDKANYIG